MRTHTHPHTHPHTTLLTWPCVDASVGACVTNHSLCPWRILDLSHGKRARERRAAATCWRAASGSNAAFAPAAPSGSTAGAVVCGCCVAPVNPLDAVALGALQPGSATGAEESDARSCATFGVGGSSGSTCRTERCSRAVGHVARVVAAAAASARVCARYIYPSIYPSIDRSAYLGIRIYVSASICVCVCIYVYISISISRRTL